MNKFKTFFILLLLLFSCEAFATHNRAGEITYRWLGGLTYEVTITTYTKTSSQQADRNSLDSVYWGDGTAPVVFPRTSQTILPNDIKINTYVNTHTYSGSSGPAGYLIHFTDPNRNEGVNNIPNSVYVPFYLESLLIINTNQGTTNNSPVLTYPPIDRGCKNRIFVHNANAYDPDGDSLSYELVICGGLGGQPIAGYVFPPAPVRFDINPITGDLTWDSPQDTGEYNVAFHIVQWRSGSRIGYVRRDMQILIGECNNQPAVINSLSDTCVLAGDTLRFDVTAIDPNGNSVELSASGGTFLLPNASTFTSILNNNDTAISRFEWATNCGNIRRQPYYAQFKALDDPAQPEIPLVSLEGRFIQVIGPPPPSLTATAIGSSIDLVWTAPPSCGNITAYNIYRRNGHYNGTIECPCQTGVPDTTGFVLLTSVGPSTLSFNDNNNGGGLSIGVEYCYLVTAVYGFNGPEGCASPQGCASLRKDAPVITNADVTTTDNITGSVYVAWSKPTELDTIQYPGPYQYHLLHSPDLNGNNFDPNPLIVYNDLNDTIFNDVNLDTRSHGWSYRVDFYYTNNGALTFKSSTAVASTIFLSIAPTDNQLNLSWSLIVPWTNNRYDIFRFNPVTSVFDSIASTSGTSYADAGLNNGTEYCYFIRSVGTYATSGLIEPIVNRSQQVCATPVDNVAPCAPPLLVESDCTENTNVLTWRNPNNFCSDDVLRYYIYYSPSLTDPAYELIDTTTSPFDTVFIHTNLSVSTGCYRVVAIDSVGNQTTEPLTVCVDTCRQYVLPSVFTPDGNGMNDLFHPCDSTTTPELQEKNCPPYKNVKAVDITIYNRWGTVVYESDDINVNWDGKEQKTKKDCPDGVYYYTAKVTFYRIRGDAPVELHGTVQLIRSE
jgi:gliding motility-associated-like protein